MVRCLDPFRWEAEMTFEERVRLEVDREQADNRTRRNLLDDFRDSFDALQSNRSVNFRIDRREDGRLGRGRSPSPGRVPFGGRDRSPSPPPPYNMEAADQSRSAMINGRMVQLTINQASSSSDELTSNERYAQRTWPVRRYIHPVSSSDEASSSPAFTGQPPDDSDDWLLGQDPDRTLCRRIETVSDYAIARGEDDTESGEEGLSDFMREPINPIEAATYVPFTCSTRVAIDADDTTEFDFPPPHYEDEGDDADNEDDLQ